MSLNPPPHLFLSCALLATGALCASSSPLMAADFEAPRAAPPDWLQSLPAEDRGPLNAWVGYLPPEFTPDLIWLPQVEGEAHRVSWSDFFGKVVVVQSWNIASQDSARRLNDVVQVVNEFSEVDVQLIALHTPDRAEDASRVINAAHQRHQVLLDPTGDFCDLLGVFRTPVNIVIGPNGAIRYVGLSADGLREAINALLDEDPANALCAGSRPLGSEPPAAQRRGRSAGFPPITGEIRGNDLRGQSAPRFHVEEWLTPEPQNIGNKVTVIEFWRTGCPHCIRAIPHKNELAQHFGDRVDIVAISSEQPTAVEQGLSSRGVSLDGLHYHVAADPARLMQNAFRPAGVPAAAVIDSNWIVRWQGHPSHLTTNLLEQIINADESGIGADVVSKRWRAERERGDREARAARVAQLREERAATRSGFPPIAGDTSPAVDFRGKPGPELHAATWVNGEPENLGRSVTVIEFWRTGCPHCIRAIPKKNELAEHFGNRVTIIGLSGEEQGAFERGLSSRDLSLDSFKYHVALDPGRKMQNAVGPRGVPYAIVLGSDWTVRWQGHPNNLSVELLDQIVRADEAIRVAGPARP